MGILPIGSLTADEAVFFKETEALTEVLAVADTDLITESGLLGPAPVSFFARARVVEGVLAKSDVESGGEGAEVRYPFSPEIMRYLDDAVSLGDLVVEIAKLGSDEDPRPALLRAQRRVILLDFPPLL